MGFFIGYFTHSPLTDVGASLLAIAVGQPASMLNVPPSSRAGSLPQGICTGRKIHVTDNQMWERW
ncbi:hypothetical protein DZG01_07150 [Pseudomonas fluorescens]|nr:hypothetical protein DZG01_07150 [Pseudomonas fluorescens]